MLHVNYISVLKMLFEFLYYDVLPTSPFWNSVSSRTRVSYVPACHICWCLVSKLCLTPVTLWCTLPGFSVRGISQARILEWVAISFSQGIFPTQGLYLHLLHTLAGRFFTTQTLGKPTKQDTRDKTEKKTEMTSPLQSLQPNQGDIQTKPRPL